MGGLDVAMAHELLDGDDVAAALDESRGIRVAEFVQRCARDFGGFGVGVALMSRLQHQAFFVEIFCHGSKLIHLAA